MVACNAPSVTGGDSVNTVRFLRGNDHTECDPFCLLMESYNEGSPWGDQDNVNPAEGQQPTAKQQSELVYPLCQHKEANEFKSGEDDLDFFDRTVQSCGPPTSPPQFSFNDKRKTRDMRAQLKAIFKQLARASEGNGGILNRGGIDKTVLLDFVADVPGLLGERLFQLFDKNRDNRISFEEFVGGLQAAYAPDSDTRMRFLFDLYDLDGNGVVDRSELFSLLYNLPADLWLNTSNPLVGGALRRDRNPSSNLCLTDEEKKTLVRRIVNLVFDQVYPPQRGGHEVEGAARTGESAGDCRVGSHEQEVLHPLVPSAPTLRIQDAGTAGSTYSYKEWSPRGSSAEVGDGNSLTFEEFTNAAQQIPELLSLLHLFDSHSLRPLLAHYSGRNQTRLAPQEEVAGGIIVGVSPKASSLPLLQSKACETATKYQPCKHSLISRLLRGSRLRMASQPRSALKSPSKKGSLLPASAASAPVVSSASPTPRGNMQSQVLPETGNHLKQKPAFPCNNLTDRGTFLRIAGISPRVCDCADSSSTALSICPSDSGRKARPACLPYAVSGESSLYKEIRLERRPEYETEREGGSRPKSSGLSSPESLKLEEGFAASADFREIHQLSNCSSPPPRGPASHGKRESSAFVEASTGDAAASIIAANSDAEGWLWKPFSSDQAECASAALLLRDFSVAPHRAPTFCTSTRVRKGAESVLLFGFDVSASDGQTVKTLYAASLQERERWISALRLSLSTPSFHDFYCLDTQTLGRGRFSVVRAATHRLTQRRVAVKILNKKRLTQISSRDAIRTEIEILRLLDHPNVVAFVEAFEGPDYFYLVFALAEHSDLRSLLSLARHVQMALEAKEISSEELSFRGEKREDASSVHACSLGLVPESVSRKILKALLLGLAHVHAKGVVHRDVKPNNLLLEFRTSGRGEDTRGGETRSSSAEKADSLYPSRWQTFSSCAVENEESDAAFHSDGACSVDETLYRRSSYRQKTSDDETLPPHCMQSPLCSVAAAPRVSFFPPLRKSRCGTSWENSLAQTETPRDAAHLRCTDSPTENSKSPSVRPASNSLCIQVLSPSHNVLAQIRPCAKPDDVSCTDSVGELSDDDGGEASSADPSLQSRVFLPSEAETRAGVPPDTAKSPSLCRREKLFSSPASATFGKAEVGTRASHSLKAEALACLLRIRRGFAALSSAPRGDRTRPLLSRVREKRKEEKRKGDRGEGAASSEAPTLARAKKAEGDGNAEEKEKQNKGDTDLTRMQQVLSDVCDKVEGIKLADFGLAAFLGPKWSATQTLGTLAYAAPEVLLNEKYDFGVDLWSVGVIAYELLTSGKMPFAAASPEEMTKKITSLDFPRKNPDGSWIIRGASARHFVDSLLCRKEERLDCIEALKHPFLAENPLSQ